MRPLLVCKNTWKRIDLHQYKQVVYCLHKYLYNITGLRFYGGFYCSLGCGLPCSQIKIAVSIPATLKPIHFVFFFEDLTYSR